VQLHKRAWRLISVAALVTFALPAATLSLATPANAQTAPLAPSTISTAGGGLIASATPGPVAFNPIGIQHTETFTCGSGLTPSSTTPGFPGSPTSPVGPGSVGFPGTTVNLVPGCYNVTAAVTDETQGTASAFTSATCGNQVATVTTGTVNCASYASPICPVGQTATPASAAPGFNFCTGNPGPTLTTGATVGTCPTGFTFTPAFSGNPATCTANAVSASNTMTVTLNPGAPHAYLITFTGYTPTQNGYPGTPGVAACAPGETFVPGPFNLTISGSAPPQEVVTPVAAGVCQFTVAAEKKYVEITNVNLTGPCTGGPVLFSEGLKSFFGPPCTLSAVALGTLILKSGVNCAQPVAPGIGPEPVNNTPAPAEYGVGAMYSCVGDTLSVINIPSSLFFPAGLPITFTTTGPGGVSTQFPAVSLNGLCAGNPGSGSVVGSTVGTVTLCPTGFGGGSVKACFNGYTTPGGTINTQPTPVCSASINFTFTAPSNQRVVPQVRWAGEKIVLTKCFGGGGLMSGAAVEFTLQGDTRANATLIPTSLQDSTVNGGLGGLGGGTATSASQNTVFTVTDVDGCASVIAYARDEGVVSVDASIFSTSSGPVGGTPLINEHAFLVYFLKFDHVDLENTTTTTYPIATLNASLAFTTNVPVPAGFPVFPGPSAATFTLPNPPGTGQVAGTSGIAVPLCAIDYVRAMVHGYFEISGDPSGRPASNVSIPNAPAGATSSYVLPAGRWVLPEDWPVLATSAGFNGFANDPTNTVYQFDLNSGFVFNPSGERADLCLGPAVPTAAAAAAGARLAPSATTSGVIPPAKYSTGPCFGQDAAGQPYSTAPQGACAGGQTIGIGPFDPTQECTNPFPLQFAPSGSLLISQGVGNNPAAFTLGPLSANSTYLPNGTLSQWDAPMPPAQVSFGIVNNGPGFLTEVNKTGRYVIRNVGGIFDSAGALVTPGVNLYPDPFYSEAIPASSLIPPITNNAGYLYDSFGFHGGGTAGFTTAGAFVPGLSSLTPVVTPANFATTCPAGFTFFAPAVCQASNFVPPSICVANGGNAAAGTCTIGTANISAPGQQNGTLAAGTNSSNFGPACATAGLSSTANSLSVTVLDGTGFTPGMTVSAFSTISGNVLAQNLQLTAVSFANTAATSGPATLTFSSASVSPGLCIFGFTAVFVSNELGVPVPSGQNALFGAGSSVSLATPGGTNASTTVGTSGLTGGGAINVVINGQTFVFLTGSQALARELGSCLLGVGPVSGPLAFGTCSPSTLIPAGTLLTVGPTTGGNGIVPVLGTVPNPYPFWQWVPNASSTAARTAASVGPTAATVYSDNHGEAEVSLQTGIASSVVPVSNGAGGFVCPANFIPVPTAAAPTNCFLNFGTLGSAATVPGGIPFSTLKAAQAAFSAATPGCLNTTATGTTSPATGATAQPSATGPAAGQICINNLGGIDFGPGATFGSTSLQVIADYPYTRGDHAPISSAVLTKNFTSMFAKTLTVSAGSAAPAGTTTYIVTISGLDVCGQPLSGEPVNVFAIGNAGAVVLAPLGSGTPNGSNAATVTLDANGNAVLSLEVLATALGNNGLIVKAVFPTEAVERFATVVPGTTTPTTTTVLYTPGYNMIGGPPGSNFSQAEAVFSYNASTGQYTNSTASDASLSSAPPACMGYYAYFASAAAVNLNVSSKSGDTAVCTLAPGFNLIGNPFGSAAQLPSGTTAYHFNGTTYDVVSLIPVGGAAFVYNSSTTSTTITLTAS